MRQRKRTRLTEFDYATPGAYFITTVVKDRNCVFGEIENGTCSLNRFGQIVTDQWRWLHDQYIYLTRDEFVVMPNHFHGIINIGIIVSNACVGNGRDRSLQDHDPLRKIKSLSELVGAFKTTSSKRIHEAGLFTFQWQTSFYDRIIRNDDELKRIRGYIQTNPRRWKLDIENQGNSSGVGNGRDRSPPIRSVQDYYDEVMDTFDSEPL